MKNTWQIRSPVPSDPAQSARSFPGPCIGFRHAMRLNHGARLQQLRAAESLPTHGGSSKCTRERKVFRIRQVVFTFRMKVKGLTTNAADMPKGSDSCL